MTKQKKPKTGDVVGWATLEKESLKNEDGLFITGTYENRLWARIFKTDAEVVAKIVLSK